MLIIPNSLPRRYRHGKKNAAMPLPPTGPVLVAATYDEQTSVTLVFASPVTVTAGTMAAVRVFDGSISETYQGDDFVIVSPTQVRVSVYYQSAYTDGGVTMTAAPPTGIVDAGNGIEWAGVTDVGLPYVG